MPPTRQLLVIAHAPSSNTRRLLEVLLAGARDPEIDAVTTRHLPPLQAGPDDVLAADAVILGTTENLGYMSGALKDFFDRSYYALLDRTEGLPYALYIRAGHDGTGTRRAVEAITGGLRWRAAQAPLVCRGSFRESFLHQCRELGMAMAAGLEAGVF